MENQSNSEHLNVVLANVHSSQQAEATGFVPSIADTTDLKNKKGLNSKIKTKSESVTDKEDSTSLTEDIDSCLDCGGMTTVGIIGFSHAGGIYHRHYCNKCYYKIKMQDADVKKKKVKPSKIEKEFINAGLRVKKKNSGTQLVVSKKFIHVDFWPTTMRWYNRHTGESGVGKEGVFHSFG